MAPDAGLFVANGELCGGDHRTGRHAGVFRVVAGHQFCEVEVASLASVIADVVTVEPLANDSGVVASLSSS